MSDHHPSHDAPSPYSEASDDIGLSDSITVVVPGARSGSVPREGDPFKDPTNLAQRILDATEHFNVNPRVVLPDTH